MPAMNILHVLSCAMKRVLAGIAASLSALMPGVLIAAPLAPVEEGRGLAGPIIVLMVIALLNIFLLAVAFRLRRFFRRLGGSNEEE